jgi:hypothetical protein
MAKAPAGARGHCVFASMQRFGFVALVAVVGEADGEADAALLEAALAELRECAASIVRIAHSPRTPPPGPPRAAAQIAAYYLAHCVDVAVAGTMAIVPTDQLPVKLPWPPRGRGARGSGNGSEPAPLVRLVGAWGGMTSGDASHRHYMAPSAYTEAPLRLWRSMFPLDSATSAHDSATSAHDPPVVVPVGRADLIGATVRRRALHDFSARFRHNLTELRALGLLHANYGAFALGEALVAATGAFPRRTEFISRRLATDRVDLAVSHHSDWAQARSAALPRCAARAG